MTTEKTGCLTAIRRWLGLGRPTPPALPYHVRADFLSPAELSFYHVLRFAVADWAVVCPKVALGDLFGALANDDYNCPLTTIRSTHSENGSRYGKLGSVQGGPDHDCHRCPSEDDHA